MKTMFVFAHPDDETFGTGGTIAKLSKEGVTVKLICATRGEVGERGSPPICSREDLPKVREEELLTAAGILGIDEVFFLGFIDGTLHTLLPSKLVKPILTLFEKEKPDVVFTFHTKGGESGHNDHISISKATNKAFNLYANSQKKRVRLYHRVTPRSFINKLKKDNMLHMPFGKVHSTANSQITTVINISDVLDKKIKASEAHKSQHQDWERIKKRKKFDEFLYEYFTLVYENGIV